MPCCEGGKAGCNNKAKGLGACGLLLVVIGIIIVAVGMAAASAGLTMTPLVDGEKKFTIEEQCDHDAGDDTGDGAESWCGHYGFYADVNVECETRFSGTKVTAPDGSIASVIHGWSNNCLFQEDLAAEHTPQWQKDRQVTQFGAISVNKETGKGTWNVDSDYAIVIVDLLNELGEAVGGILTAIVNWVIGIILWIVASILCCAACCCMGLPPAQAGGGVVVGSVAPP